MADGYALALQAALAAYLPLDAGVSELVGARVYDEPPQRAQRPYVRFNAFDPRPIRSDCGLGATVIFSLEAHSRPNSGRVEATRCAEALVNALEGADLNLVGFTLVRLHWITQTVDLEADGKSYSAIIVFEALIDG